MIAGSSECSKGSIILFPVLLLITDQFIIYTIYGIVTNNEKWMFYKDIKQCKQWLSGDKQTKA